MGKEKITFLELENVSRKLNRKVGLRKLRSNLIPTAGSPKSI